MSATLLFDPYGAAAAEAARAKAAESALVVGGGGTTYTGTAPIVVSGSTISMAANAYDSYGAAAAVAAASLATANNLSDLTNQATARNNLGLGTAATQAASAFDAAGAATSAVATETSRAQAAEALLLVKSNNLSDLASASTARTNLGLGTAATQATSAFDAAGVSAAETTRATAAETALTRAVVSTTYTTGGAIAITDTISKLKQTAAATYTLAVGTVAGSKITLLNAGVGTATITVANLYGVANVALSLAAPVSGTPGGIRNLYWDATDSTYYLFS